MSKKVALYCRVSTDTQATGLEAQERSLIEYCRSKGITEFEVFRDLGVSGAKSSRPALDNMLAAVRAGKFNAVVCYSFSRFARSTNHLLTALNEFKGLNVSFISLTEALDTSTPIGTALYTIIAAISELERDLIRERVRNGMKNARAKGKQIGRLKERPSELIRALLKQGLPYREIAKLAHCSHGSVAAEAKAMRGQEAAPDDQRLSVI